MAGKKKLNPIERALAQADNIIAANQELERATRVPKKKPIEIVPTKGKREPGAPLGMIVFNDRRKKS